MGRAKAGGPEGWRDGEGSSGRGLPVPGCGWGASPGHGSGTSPGHGRGVSPGSGVAPARVHLARNALCSMGSAVSVPCISTVFVRKGDLTVSVTWEVALKCAENTATTRKKIPKTELMRKE